jgi:hypothetical protein
MRWLARSLMLGNSRKNQVGTELMNAVVEVIAPPQMEKLFHENSDRARYARCVKASKRVRWEIDADVFRGRTFDFRRKFLPDGLTRVNELGFLSADDKRTMSQVQGRTYAYIFSVFERYIGAKVLELASRNGLGDQVILEGLVRFSDEEIKHQELFRRIESMIASKMAGGYVQSVDANEIATAVLGKSTWAVLALTCHIELFTQVHYRESIERDEELSDLYRDIFRFHWLEECQHAVIDEIEWSREDRNLTSAQRDAAVDDLIELICTVDDILRSQAAADAAYFMRLCDRSFDEQEQRAIRDSVLRAYRWQYIGSGAQHPHFAKLISGMTTPAQMQRLQTALRRILQDS